MEKQRGAAVQCTNDSSTVSKYSMASRGYFQHEFLKFFTRKQSFRSPLINRGYYVRVKCMHSIILSFLKAHLSTTSEEGYQIVSFGAGFDSMYFQLKSEGHLSSSCTYVEIDFMEVAKKKRSLIQNSILIDMISSCRIHSSTEVVIASRDYVLIGLDLKDISRLTMIFREIGICDFVPTLFLSECAITYMDVASSNNLIQWTANKFPNAIFVTYEQINPYDGFGRIMLQHFTSIGSPLKSIESFSTINLQQERYKQLGWSTCFAINMNEFYNSLSQDERKRIFSLELFDEFEEWHLKCSHYVTVLACQGLLLSLFEDQLKAFKVCRPLKTSYTETLEWEQLPICSSLQRFGHKTTMINERTVVAAGGFGNSDGRHQRLNDLIFYDVRSSKHYSHIISHENNAIETRIIHHSLVHLVCGCLVVVGGRASPKKPWKEVLLLCASSQYDDSTENHHLHEKVPYSVDDLLSCTGINKSNFVWRTMQIFGESPCSRWRHTASYVSRNGAGSIVVYGGCNLKCAALGDCFILSTVTWQWTQIETNTEIIVPRHSHAASVWNSSIIVSCGLSEESEPLNSLCLLDIKSLIWTTLPVVGILPRYSHTSHVWNDKLVIIGGVNTSSDFCPGVAVVNLLSYEMKEIKLPTQDPEHPILLHKHSSELIPNTDKVIIFGGGGNCFSFGTHLNPQPLLLPLEQFNTLV